MHGLLIATVIVSVTIMIPVIITITIPVIIAIMIPVIIAVTIPVMVPVMIPVMIPLTIRFVIGRSGVHQKIRAASPVHPNAISIESPSGALGADGMTPLALHSHAATRVRGANVTPAVFGSAGQSVLGKALRSRGQYEHDR